MKNVAKATKRENLPFWSFLAMKLSSIGLPFNGTFRDAASLDVACFDGTPSWGIFAKQQLETDLPVDCLIDSPFSSR